MTAKSTLTLLIVALTAAAGLASLPNEEKKKPLPSSSPAPQPTEPMRLDRHGDPLPPGAIARLGTTDRRFDEGTMAWVDEGRTIIACNRALSFRWLNARTGEVLKSQDWTGLPWKSVLLSPNGKILAAVDGEALTFWDTTTGQCLRRYDGYHGNGDCPLVFSKDSRSFALANNDRNAVTLHHFDLGTGQRRIVGEHPGVMALALSPDGKRLASGGPNNEIHCWDIATSRDLWHVRHSIFSLSFSHGGRYLAFEENQKLFLLDAATGKDVEEKIVSGYPLGFDPAGGRDKQGRLKILFGNLLGFGPKGDTFVLSVCDKHGIMGDTAICDFATGKKRFQLPARGVHFSPDGKTIAGFQGIALQCWDAATGKPLLADLSLRGHTSAAKAMAYSPDGKVLATVGDDHTARLWEVASSRLVRTFPDVGHWPRIVLFTPDGKQLITCGGDRSCFRFWDVDSGKPIRRLVLRPEKDVGEPRHVHLSADGRVLSTLTYIRPPLFATDPGTSTLTRWDIRTGKPLAKPLPMPPTYAADYFLAFSPEGRAFVVDEKDVHDVPDGQERIGVARDHFIATPLARQGLTFSPDGALVAAPLGKYEQPHILSGVVNQGIHVWERATGSLVIRLTDKEMSHLAFSPDGSLLATVGSDQLRVWEIAGGKEVYRQSVKKDLLYEYGCPLVFAPDGHTLAVALRDTTITLWEVPAKGPKAAERTPLPAMGREQLWADLLLQDAAKAYAAMGKWIAHPTEAVELFRQRIRTVEAVRVDELHRLINNLDSDDFRRREAASYRLADLGPQADTSLRAALAKAPSLEMRKRIETLLSARKDLTPETLRNLRAVRVLEQIDTVEARELLAILAAGAANARLAGASQAALKRLESRRRE